MTDFTVSGVIDVDAARGIRGIKKFRRELKGLMGDLRVASKEIDKLSKKSVEIDVKTQTKELDKLKTSMESIRDEKVKIDVESGFNPKKLQKDYQGILRVMKQLEDGEISVGADTDKAFEDIERLRKELSYLESVGIEVELDGFKEVIAEARKLRAETDAAMKPNPKLEVEADTKGIDAFKESMSGALASVVGGAGTSGMIAAIVALISTVGPLGAAVAGAAGGVAGGFAVMGTAAASFGILAIPTIKELAGVITGKLEPTGGVLLGIKQKFDSLKKSYEVWVKALRPDILASFNNLLSSASTLLGYIGPIALEVGDAMRTLTASMSDALKTDEWKSFFSYVEANAQSFTEGIGKFFGNMITGFANLVVALDPLTKMVGRGFLNMSNDFLTWSRTLDENQSFQKFLAYMQEMGPVVWDTLKALGGALISLAINLAPLGEALLGIIEKVSSWYTELQKTNPEFASFVTTAGAAALILAPMAGAIGGLLSPIAGLAKALPGLSFGPLATTAAPLVGISSGLAAAIGAVVAAIAGLGIVALLSKDTEEYSGMIEKLKGSFEKIKEAVSDAWDVLIKLWEDFKETGAIEAMQRAIGNFADAMGTLAPILKPIAALIGVNLLATFTALAYAIEGISIVVKAWAELWMIQINAIVDAFTWLYDVLVGHSIIPDLINKIIEWFTKLPGAVLAKIIEFKDKAVEKFKEFATKVREVVGNFKTWIGEKWNQIKTGSIEKIESMKEAVKNKFSNLVSGIKEKVTAIPTWLRDKFQAAKEMVTNKITALKESALAIVGRVITGIKEKFGRVKEIITGAFSGAGSWLRDAGAKIIDGLVNAIQSGFEKVKSLLNSLTDMIPDWKGPEKTDKKLLEPAGEWIIRGLIKGITNERNALRHTLSSITTQISTQPFSMPDSIVGNGGSDTSPIDGLISGSGSGVRNYYIDVRVPVGADKAQTGREIVEAIKEYEGAGGRAPTNSGVGV